MPRNLRDRFEVLKFDAMENTVGTCLRSILHRLRQQEPSVTNHRKPLNPPQPNSQTKSR